MNNIFDRDHDEDVNSILASELIADLRAVYTTKIPTHENLLEWIDEYGYETVNALTQEVALTGGLDSPGGYMYNKLNNGWSPPVTRSSKTKGERSLWLTNLYTYLEEHGEVEVFASPVDDETSEEPEVILTADDISFLMENGPSSYEDSCSDWTEEIRNRVFWILCLGTRLTSDRNSIPELLVSKKFEAFKSMYDFYVNKYNPDLYERIIKVREYMVEQINLGVSGKDAFIARYGALGLEVEL